MLIIKPISLKDANNFVLQFHRHHSKVQGCKFSICCIKGNLLAGVAICGRPVSRFLDDGFTIEITRLCTDGSKNVCSKLYSACARISREMGYKKIITYILSTESGVSLIAAGWEADLSTCGGGAWHRDKSRLRSVYVSDLFNGESSKYPLVQKKRFCKNL